VKAFGGLFQTAMKDGAMTAREKELVALGIGLAVRCDNCIYAHVQKAVRAGATREQVLETAGVAVMMQGGPAYTYLPRVVEALDALETD
jgi:AhpD family alkylhydroperoxidase